MSLRALRGPELLALAGSLALFVLLFLDWFSVGVFARVVGERVTLHTSGWSSLGWLAVALAVVCIVLVLALVALLVAGRGDAATLPVGVALAVLAPVTFVVVLVVVLSKPGLGADLPDDLVAIEPAAVLGVLALAAIAFGGLLSLRDERTTGPERAFTAPEPLPPPGS